MKKLTKLSALDATPASSVTDVARALGGTVTVVTSFPKELTGIYKTAFEKANPGIKLEILNKSTTQGIAYVRELPEGQRPDIFWASAPDAFEVLVGQKLLADVAGLANKTAPTKVGNYPINDPNGMYLGQALGGYGLMWNTRYMAASPCWHCASPYKNQSVKIFPGFKMLFGSSACLMVRIMATAPAPVSLNRKSILCKPMPCSPLQVPSMPSARVTKAWFKRSAVSRSSGWLGSIR